MIDSFDANDPLRVVILQAEGEDTDSLRLIHADRGFEEAWRVPTLLEAALEAALRGTRLSLDLRVGPDDEFSRVRFLPVGGLRVALVIEPSSEEERDPRELEHKLRARTKLLEEANRRLSAKSAELERRNRELDRFAYAASHDLRAPLRSIELLARWIGEDAAEHLPDASKEHLATLKGRIERMDALLRGLLDYSRAARLPSTFERVDLGPLVRRCIELIGPPSGFEFIVAEDLPSIQSVPQALERVFMNLLDNSVKHHHRDSGRVSVSWRPAPKEGFIEFTVEDDGPGVDPRYHARMLEMFQTLRPRDEVEGAGIGLALVRRVVESAGGRLSLDSAAGQGMRVRFTWPRSGLVG